MTINWHPATPPYLPENAEAPHDPMVGPGGPSNLSWYCDPCDQECSHLQQCDCCHVARGDVRVWLPTGDNAGLLVWRIGEEAWIRSDNVQAVLDFLTRDAGPS